MDHEILAEGVRGVMRLLLLLQVPYRQHVQTQLACFKLLVLADIVRALLQNATLGTSLACAAAQLSVGVVAPSLVLRQLEVARQVTKGCEKATPT